ncbi:LytTR family DNA-binding domain-containing protein [Tateyamaria sp. SN3-11]|uniref:LytTR family DNA-binding domain-containing protein n=1 Tax=Tateyamaria sp. SN3-11 TaxID=3092147 RepID=UPI0039ECEA78
MPPEHLDPRTAWLPFLVAAGLVLSVAFVLINPASAATLPVWPRTLFWALHIFPALLFLQAAQTGLTHVPGYGRPSIWVWVAGAGLLGAALFTPWALWLDAAFGLDTFDLDEGAPEEGLLSEFANLAPILVILWLALNAGRVLRLQPPPQPQNGTAPDRPAPAIWGRVPAALGRDLIALSAELHYVRVRTTRGSDLILYPFGTALTDLAVLDGMQVHRSHWVVLRHVVQVERIGQRAQCHLSDGSSVPVSRSYRAALERAVADQGSTRA